MSRPPTEVTKRFVKLSGITPGPKGRRPIGYRGRHEHGKVLYDPVYPTLSVPHSLVPRYPNDWRNAGRALLSMALSRLEGKRIHTHPKALRWQHGGFCSQRCGVTCAKSPWRLLCALRVGGTDLEHFTRMDGMLRDFKGEVQTRKPLFTVKRRVAQKNRYCSEAASWDSSRGRFVYALRESVLPAFNIQPNRRDDRYGDEEEDYDSGSDEEAESEVEDSDDENEGKGEEKKMQFLQEKDRGKQTNAPLGAERGQTHGEASTRAPT
uniref:Uncharacterized protein n=1 Tax=Chromera velia CCMP2878 TaxID=1169474 RepID=A0A0G4H8Y1_9ALVE|mmetsp:Transcript_15050/g.30481  ORF Transcript_15050/g.30481 Transcript_15050/m.30481 type:complete len:265 (+) Transcript_15050:214-1008(+)|eukprot:Cvel_25256.t1-p1 / transcript=Cvel_25256.t1 / gene=Cvel_25256 / organism=Chromera_velia_CCMP2878 / gene_product=hypothetical protein / transcript_product=hypothetical protein / location=Cvel_scaffold2834:18118-20282(+) / protein_length=264 / sequence_SO=supercontig / SO=protein_coding / is_pseudo=false